MQDADPRQREELFSTLVEQITGRDLEKRKLMENFGFEISKLTSPFQCADTFYLNQTTQKCEKCFRGCQQCDENSCLKCVDGLYFNGSDCTRCDPSCKSCDAAGEDSCMSC